MHPSAREVLLARLLVHIIDQLIISGALTPDTEGFDELYNSIKSFYDRTREEARS